MKRHILALLPTLLLVGLCSPFAAAQSAWPHEGSDLKADPAITWGALPNGMRYAIMQHREPGQLAEPNRRVSMRLHVRVGSLMEQQNEHGLAHFLEHMAFNGTKHFPAGEMHRYFQRLGMSFGAHTNASTDWEKTIYQLELPVDAYLDDALTLLRDYADGMLLADEEIAKERGVILSEKLARDTPDLRMMFAGLKFFLPDSLIPRRTVLGDEEVIRQAPRERFESFYRRWYTPDRMTLVIVGPVKAADVAEKLAKKFDDLKPSAKPVADPDLGKVVTGSGFRTKMLIEKEAGKAEMSITVLRPYRPRRDTQSALQEQLPRTMAYLMLNRRLAKLTNGENPPFLRGTADNRELLRFVETDSVDIEAKPDGWERALTTGVYELRRALNHGFTTAEFRETKATLLAGMEQTVQGASTRTVQTLADTIVNSVTEGKVVMHPSERAAILTRLLESLTMEQCAQSLSTSWNSKDISILVQGNISVRDGDQRIKEVFTAACKSPVEPPVEEQELTWGYGTFGAAGEVVKREEVKDLGITLVTFKNNVRLNLKPTDFEKDTIRINMNFGAGRLTAPKDKPGLIDFASTFTMGGLQKHSFQDVKRLVAGKNVSANFNVGDEFFTLFGATNRKDLAFQLQLLAAYASSPGYRSDLVPVFGQQVEALYQQWEHSPEGMLNLKMGRFLTDNDYRLGNPALAEINARTMADLKAWLADQLQSSWLEIGVVGDFKTQEVIDAVAATFGALPVRASSRPDYANERKVAIAGPQDKVFRFESRIPKSLVVVNWPTTGMRSDIALARRIDILAAVLNDRVMQKVREELGQTYTPQVISDMSLAFTGKGEITCLFPCEAKDAAKLGQVVRDIAGKLAVDGITAEELERAKNPLVKEDEHVRRENGWWMGQVADAQSFPQRLAWIRSRTEDYKSATVAEINRMAKAYLPSERSILVSFVPEAPAEKSGD